MPQNIAVALPTRTIHAFVQEEIRLRKPIRQQYKAKRDELKAQVALLKKKAHLLIRTLIRDFKNDNAALTEELKNAIDKSDASVALRFDLENVTPQRALYRDYTCLFCGVTKQSLRPKKFCCDAHRQASYRVRKEGRI